MNNIFTYFIGCNAISSVTGLQSLMFILQKLLRVKHSSLLSLTSQRAARSCSDLRNGKPETADRRRHVSAAPVLHKTRH